jgi:hypothetical protein
MRCAPWLQYTRAHADSAVWDGAGTPGAEEVADRRQKIGLLADRIDALTEDSRTREVANADFEAILGELHQQGFSSEGQLVSAVAFARQRGQ